MSESYRLFRASDTYTVYKLVLQVPVCSFQKGPASSEQFMLILFQVSHGIGSMKCSIVRVWLSDHHQEN
jgi:hypothetical protein